VKRFALLLAFAGCAGHAPPPKIEQAGLQTAWEAPPSTPQERVEATWWRAFHDPVLDGLIATADQRNLDVRLAAARVREARAQRGGARAELFPALSATGAITTGRQRGGDADEITTSAELAAEVSWEVDLFGRLRGAARAAAADVLAAAADRDAMRVSVIAEVATSYIELRLFQQQKEIAEKNVAAQEQTVRIARRRFEQGVTSRLDVSRTEAISAATRSQVAQADELAEAARHRLVLLLATTPQELALPASGPIPQADPVTVLLTPTQVIAQRPDVRAAERRLVAAAARLDAAAALRWPRLTLGGLVGVGADDLSGPSSSNVLWNLGASLLAPIFDFGRIRAQIDAADARQEQAYLAYERTARGALAEVQTAIVLYARGLAQQQELTVAVDASRRAAEIARKQYAEGTLSLLEVLDSDRTVYQNELAWSRATADVALRAVRLHQTMGVIPR
jgi:NodT family efflux transporter outer membrane factor (OMF) lipoprotein